MGKGDKKTKRGKIVNRSYGVRRPKNKNKTTAVAEKPSAAKKTKKAKKA
jgi:30S ribosomal protein S31